MGSLSEKLIEEQEEKYNNIPGELKSLRQWVCFELQPVEVGKPKKIPKDPHTGLNARVNDSSTWGSFDDAMAACGRFGFPLVAFTFTESDSYVGIDIDNCVQNGVLSELALEVLNRFKTTYCELSQSGTGLHILCKGSIPEKGRKNPSLNLEVYSADRFFIVSGNAIKNNPITELQGDLDSFYKKYFKKEEARKPSTPLHSLSLGDQEILDKASKARNGLTFAALMGGDTAGHNGDHSAADQALCNLLAFWTQDVAQIDRIFRSSGLYRPKWERADYRTVTINKALNSCSSHYDPDHGKIARLEGKKLIPNLEELPEIEIVTGNLSPVVDKAEEILISKHLGIYQRSGRLVRIIREANRPKPKKSKEKKNIERPEDALVIADAEFLYLTEVLGKNAKWVRFDERTQKLKQKDCPEKIAKLLIARREWNLPILTGIIQTPTLRRDGSILDKPGYDSETGLFFDPGETKFPKIKESPTIEDAKRSLEILKELIEEFPFENEASRSVSISSILTAVIRKVIRTAPLHGFTAPKMRSGKSLLADVVGLIATGKVNCAIPHAENEAEEKKRLLAVLAEGDPVVCFDNIERPFGSAALCSVLTQTEYKDRILGSTRNLSVLTNTTFLATGNNLKFSGDISTRTILCRLDPRCERPEERIFKKDLYAYIPQNRPALVEAAITILRAYHFAGRPKQDISPYGGFEEWSDFVRSALIWLGMKDPCETRREIESCDPVRVVLGNMLSAWHEIYGDLVSKKLKDVLQDVKEKGLETLENALSEIASDSRGEINSISLGKKLSAFKGRIENGYCLDSKSYQGVELWRVTRVGG